MNVTFTKNEFFAQIGHFRTLMTDKKFMEGPEEKRDIAVNALHFAYTRVEGTKEDLDDCAMMLRATCEEYGHRLAYITMAPLRKAFGMRK